MPVLRRSLLPSLLCVALAGCLMGPDYHRPEVEVPASYRFAEQGSATGFNAGWWSQFKDPVLDELINKAIAQNKDLAIATARIEEYQGRVTTTSSALFPQFSANAGAGRERAAATELTPSYETSQVQLNAMMSWEIDLFGKLRRLRESAKADLLGTEYARQATLVSLEANVASAYITLRDLDQRLLIARATVESREGALHLFQERFQGGVISQVQLSQAESEYAVAKTSEAAIDQQIAQQEDALSLLLGQNPGPIPRGKPIDQISLPAIPAGLPSELLNQRPDIRAAEQALISANAQIGAAKAQYFPTISLTGLLGRASTGLGSLWDGPAKTWAYAGGISQPIFTGGAISGSVKQAEARQQQALLGYQSAIQSAFADVDNALVGEQRTKEQLAFTDDQVRSLHKYASLSRDLYEGGYTSYLEVLDAERSLFNAQLTQSGLQAQRLIEVINVYKALGYGWPTGPDALADSPAH
ncbi:MAG TPA: efflux transporter outer membrane subunit [Dyella sp.]|uniref:efflux transporter outer membrane subunit n=1 Tax=Dyella sp. TaxID=1869338 RepID=UPI002D76C5B8|nr:efflux transporter outer membrane subunit [Dyella sp.]HET6552766.1 efflux transporter outer membrane subunit [Dyella sp.]